MTRRRARYAPAVAVLSIGACHVENASWLARPAASRIALLAHRGVHQGSACQNVQRDSCTAICMSVPTHDFLENTIRSMRAAFDLGADVVELDVHPTTDGDFAVFHDWRLECRTDGSGVTRERSMAYLRTLDVGYGYSADGGLTFPLRGKGVGQMPSLGEVLDTFVDKRFLVHIKSDDESEGDRLARYLLARPESQRRRLIVYGADRPVARVRSLVPDLRVMSRESDESCALHYAAVGWTGYVPRSCRSTMLLLPENRAWLLWGWPHRFVARMQGVGTDVFLVRTSKSGWLRGIDDAEEMDGLRADHFSGGVWTDRIEAVAR